MGLRIGRPSSSIPAVTSGRPCCTREMSEDVPPTSKVMMSGTPVAVPICAAPTTPVDGPESTSRTGRALAVSNGITPPLDWVTWGVTVRPLSCSLRCSRSRYRWTTGPT
jgi:hypothetical protein